jgi:hypothetical protein
MKHLATALKLASKFDRIDRLANDWIGRGMREKKAEDFEETSERRDWYELRDNWEKATGDLRKSVNKFIQETGFSPILRYAHEGDRIRVYLGLDVAQAKGYRIVDVVNFPQWFEDLNLETENMSEDQVLSLVSVERMSEEQERTLRQDFVEDLRMAGVERFADYVARYEATIDRRRTYNENVFRVDDLVETIKQERALALPRPTLPAVPEKVPERPPPPAPPTFELRAYWGKSPRGLTALWHELYENGVTRTRGNREMRAKPRDELSAEIAEDLQSVLEGAGLSPQALAQERRELIEKLLGSLPSDLVPTPAAPPTPSPPIKISRSEFDARFTASLNNWNTFNVQLLRPGLAGEIHYTVPEREAELVAKFTPDYIMAIGKADVDAQRETSWKTYNDSYDRKPEYGDHYLQHLDDIVHTLSRKVADQAFRAIMEEVKKPAAPPPGPPLGLREEQKHLLEGVFKRVLEQAGVKEIPLATFQHELAELQEELQTVERDRAYDMAYRRIVDLAESLIPKIPRMPTFIPPTAPPPPRAPAPSVAVPPVEMLGPRRRDLITVQCWVPNCLNECVVDKDLMRRVMVIPVLKAYSPRGARYEPLLPLPPLFFYSCEEHKEERFGYRSVYDALAYLLYESRSSTKRLAITKGTFADIGLDQDDVNAIQAAEAARWVPK